MSTTTTQPQPQRRTTGALRAMYAGVVLTLAATAAPYVDRATGNVLADHIRDGYPAYSPDRVDSAVTAWLVVLSVVGALGLAGWATTIRAVRAGRRWAPWAATALFVAGVTVALTTLLTKDTSGEVGLAPLLGLVGLLPSLAGAAAVTLLSRRRAT
jgi:hypothetical protein